MKTTLAFALIGLLSVATLGYADIIQAYNDTGANAGGAGGPLDIGRQFTVTGSGITVEQLGVYDAGRNGLVNDHVVTLFSISNLGNSPTTTTPLASVDVPSGNLAPMSGGFRFGTIPDLFLPAGTYSVVAYGTNVSGGDPYGDNGGTPNGSNNVTAGSFDPYQFTSNVSPAYPQGGDSGNHSSASFLYQVGNVPEPGSLVLFGLGACGLFLAARRNRRG